MPVKSFIAPLRSGAALRSAGVLMLGTLAAQLIAIAISPILSRRYDPAAFGVFGIYLSITNMLLVVATARYENAILLPKLDNHARLIKKLASNISFAIGGVLAFVLCVDRTVFGNALSSASGLGAGIWFVPATAVLLGLHQSLTNWLLRGERYRQLAIARLLRAAGAGISQLTFSVGSMRATGLILGQMAGQVIAVIALQKSIGRLQKPLVRKTGLIRQMVLARRYSRFVKLELPQAVLNSFSQQLPVFGLATLFGLSSTGFYVMATRVLIMPVALIGQSMRQVILQRASVLKRSGLPISPLVRSFAMLLLVVGIGPMIFLMMYGPELFALVLGTPWREAGVYAVMMAPWILMIFVKESVLGIIPALSLQGTSLVFESVGLVARTMGLVIAGWSWGPLYAVGAYAAIGALINAIFIVVVLLRSRLLDAKLTAGG